jgi:hypothetical protein
MSLQELSKVFDKLQQFILKIASKDYQDPP